MRMSLGYLRHLTCSCLPGQHYFPPPQGVPTLFFNTSIGQIVTVSQIRFKMLQFIKVILCMCQLVYASTVEWGANMSPKRPG